MINVTIIMTELIWGQHCDDCHTYVPAGTLACYNPISKKVYCNEGCLQDAEVGDI